MVMLEQFKRVWYVCSFKCPAQITPATVLDKPTKQGTPSTHNDVADRKMWGCIVIVVYRGSVYGCIYIYNIYCWKHNNYR